MSANKRSSVVLDAAKGVLQAQPKQPSILSADQGYVTGIRGILVILSFVWLFFQTFIPALVTNPLNDYVPQPTYQVAIRKVFSPILWDGSLIYAFFIILSGRTVCIHFLEDASTNNYACSLISRPIRIGIPISIALAISMAIFSTIDTSYITQASYVIKSPTLVAPDPSISALVGFNSIFNLLWVYKNFTEQMGNQLWPSGTLWVPSLIYYQSWTVYMFMVILPFSRPGWHTIGLVLFGFGSFWFNTWGWYSAIGLLIADLSLNPGLRSALERGIPLPKTDFRIPYWSLAMLSFACGLALKYIFIAAFPNHINAELNMHPGKFFQKSDGLGNFNPDLPYPRFDNFLFILGILLAIEVSELSQRWLSARPLKYFGKRSFSMFVSQSIILYTAGLKLFVHLYATKNMSSAGAKAVVLITCIPATVLGGEIFYRLVDQPSQWFARAFFRWTRR